MDDRIYSSFKYMNMKGMLKNINRSDAVRNVFGVAGKSVVITPRLLSSVVPASMPEPTLERLFIADSIKNNSIAGRREGANPTIRNAFFVPVTFLKTRAADKPRPNEIITTKM